MHLLPRCCNGPIDCFYVCNTIRLSDKVSVTDLHNAAHNIIVSFRSNDRQNIQDELR